LVANQFPGFTGARELATITRTTSDSIVGISRVGPTTSIYSIATSDLSKSHQDQCRETSSKLATPSNKQTAVAKSKNFRLDFIKQQEISKSDTQNAEEFLIPFRQCRSRPMLIQRLKHPRTLIKKEQAL